MNKLLALCYFLLSLYGCDVGGSTHVHRSLADGAEALHSRVITQGGIALFECVRSASGECHYSVFPRNCHAVATPAAGGRCAADRVERFVIADGDSRLVPGLQAFSVCVSERADVRPADCAPAAPGAGVATGLAQAQPKKLR